MESRTDIFHLLFQTGHSGQNWANLKERAFSRSPFGCRGPRASTTTPCCFLKLGAGLEADQSGHKLVHKWYAITTGGGVAYSALPQPPHHGLLS